MLLQPMRTIGASEWHQLPSSHCAQSRQAQRRRSCAGSLRIDAEPSERRGISLLVANRDQIGQSAPVDHGSEMFRHLPFPFDGDVFPPNLGAVIQLTVLNGDEPAREVVHAEDGSWLIGDGINDPNERGAVVASHMVHAVERNSSIAELAVMPPGHTATRSGPGASWVIERHAWPEEP